MLAIGAFAWYWAARRFRRKGLAFLWAAAGGVLFYLYWCVSSQQARFILPLFFPVLFLAASGLAWLPVRWRNAALAVIAAATLLSFQPEVWKNFYYAWRSMPVARQAPADFLRFADREKEYANLLDYIGRTLPEEAKVMLVFDRRGLYMPRRCVLGTPFFQEAFFTPGSGIAGRGVRRACAGRSRLHRDSGRRRISAQPGPDFGFRPGERAVDAAFSRAPEKRKASFRAGSGEWPLPAVESRALKVYITRDLSTISIWNDHG